MFGWPWRAPALGLIGLVLAGTNAAPAQAHPLVERDCTRCPATENVLYSFDSRNADTIRRNPYAGKPSRWYDQGAYPGWQYSTFSPSSQPANPNEHYNSAIRDLTYKLFANRRVMEINFVFQRFEMVPQQDWFEFSRAYTTGFTGLLYTPFVHREELVPIFSSFSFEPVVMRVNALAFDERGFSAGGNPPWSDPRNFATDDGFLISSAGTCCDFPVSGVYIPEAETATRHQLMLLGDGDHLEFRYPNDLSSTDTMVVIWPAAAPAGATYDIYARCNAPPTDSQHGLSTEGFPSGTRQALLLLSELCPVPGDWYITVHQTGPGAGTVNMVVTRHYERDSVEVSVGFDFPPRNADVDHAKTMGYNAARFLYGASEGTQIISRVRIHNTPDCDDCGGVLCLLCLTDEDRDTANCCPGGHVLMGRNHWEAELDQLLAHEWGHQFLQLGDEYAPGFAYRHCGHSLMGANWASQNFCIGDDHYADQIGLTTDYVRVVGGVWNQMFPIYSPIQITDTPDYYDYRDHPMGDFVGFVEGVSPGGSGGGSCSAVATGELFPRHIVLWIAAMLLCVVVRFAGRQGGVL